MQRGVGAIVRAVVKSVLPSLRVVALVYTGLSAIAALVVVVTASVAPKAPVVQQVTEATQPARQVVTTLVQPTGDAITTLMAPAPAPVAPVASGSAPTPTDVPFVDTATLDVTIEDVPPTPEPAVVQVVTRPRVVATLEPAPDAAAADDTQDEDLSVDETVPAPIATDVVVQPAEVPMVQQMASVDAPKPLPTVVPTPAPETPEHAKARVDAANQAAIDAQKTAAADAKARADAANQAAIDAQKAPVMANAALTLPSPTATADPKLAAARAKAEADAANEAAIEAARAAAAKKK